MSTILKKGLEFILHSHLFIGLCALALAYFSVGALAGQVLSFELGILVLAGTVCLYSIHRFIQSKVYSASTDLRVKSLIQHRKLYIGMALISSVCAALCWIIYFHDEYKWFLIPGLLGASYVIPWTKSWKRFRDLPFVKIWLISLCWVWITVVIPLQYQGLEPSVILLHALQTGFFILGITIPFDIRDLDADTDVGLKTIVRSMGIKTAVLIGVLCEIVSGVFTMYLYFHDLVEMNGAIAMGVTQAVSIWMILASKKERGELFYGIVLDGMMIIPFLVWNISAIFEDMPF